jgi:hypothetical protein
MTKSVQAKGAQLMYKMSRAFAILGVALAVAIGGAGPSAILAEGAAAKTTKRHCVKYKTVKLKNGKRVKRCAKYSK